MNAARDSVVVPGMNASAPIAPKSVSETCTPIEPRKRPSG
jgi:hypothetical protein